MVEGSRADGEGGTKCIITISLEMTKRQRHRSLAWLHEAHGWAWPDPAVCTWHPSGARMMFA
jgi:hypothetical protein